MRAIWEQSFSCMYIPCIVKVCLRRANKIPLTSLCLRTKTQSI